MHQQIGVYSAEQAATQLQVMLAGTVHVTPVAQHSWPWQTNRIDAVACACMSRQPLAWR